MEAWICSGGAGYGAQSSRTITMSEAKLCCIAMDWAGPRNTSAPSTGERKRTPSGAILRRFAKLKT